MELSFSYSVHWVDLPHIPPSQALEIQLKSTMPHGHQNMDIHWLAIINSFVLMLLILSLFLLIIIRVVRSDLSHYLQIPDEELNAVEEETGWKLLHADVFRSPKHLQEVPTHLRGGSGRQLPHQLPRNGAHSRQAVLHDQEVADQDRGPR